MEFGRALTFLREQEERGVMPSAAVAIGRRDEGTVLEAFGSDGAPDPQPVGLGTKYDMASLTKTMATAMVALKLMERGSLSLYDTIGAYLDAPEDKSGITLLELLTHTSGMPAHILIETQVRQPEDALACLLDLPMLAPAGREVVYSCLGYIILGKILERVGGSPLDALARELVFRPLGMGETGFCPAGGSIAATEPDPATGIPLHGVVHDENARYLGGVAGNAGLFSTVGDVALFASMLSMGGGDFLPRPAFDLMVRNHTPDKAESRGLGFSLADGRPLSCGELFSVGSFGHTGFTGTSLWVDARTGLYVVLLTNAVRLGRNRDAFFRARRAFHNLVMLGAGEERP